MGRPGDEEARAIRVFVSSTFQDMQAEREELVKRVFPALRRLCASRDVAWSEVDLRWGISGEQQAEGAVLPICLAEIHRCRPYFLGLLGERYGWVPEHLAPDALADEPWLASHGDRSVTELEIFHGALNHPDVADHAFFYFRDPAYLERLPASDRADYVTVDARARAKLEALKHRIRASGLPLREGYADPQALGALVLEDLTRVIEARFPADERPDPLEREKRAHEAFARSRRRVYVGGDRHLAALDAHVEGRGPPLVVLGESGVGKSALLANAAARVRARHEAAFVFSHFVGATSASTDGTALLRRVLGELGRAFDLGREIPSEPHELRSAFAEALREAAARAGGRPIVLFLDALEKLEDAAGVRDLVWLPESVPGLVRVVLSTLPGRSLEAALARGWPTLVVEPLGIDDRRRLIRHSLARHAKTLDSAHVERIAAVPQSGSPLYLQALLEELRVHGTRRTLPERIEHYLEAPTPAALFARILARYEADYEADRPGLVRDAMSLLWASRAGLAESELLDLLGRGDDPLPGAYWSPLFLAAEETLTVRAGRLSFFHEHLREAARRRYLPTEDLQRARHRELAAWFAKRDIGARRVEEQPWQLARAGAWDELAALLADPAFFVAAMEDPAAVQSYWARIEEQGGPGMVDAYRRVLDAPGSVGLGVVWSLAVLLGRTARLHEAEALWTWILETARKAPESRELSFALGNLASILTERGEFDRALALLGEQESRCRRGQDGKGILQCLHLQARILEGRGELKRALLKRQEEERLATLLGERSARGRALGGQVSILRRWGRHEEAAARLEMQEALAREEGDEEGRLAALGERATVLEQEGRLDAALALHDEAEAAFRQRGERDQLATCQVNRMRLLWKLGDLEGARRAQEEAERLAEATGSRPLLEACLWGKARLLDANGRPAEALEAFRRQEALCRELGLEAHRMACVEGQAVVLARLGDHEGALERLEEQERICRRLGDDATRCACLWARGATLANLGRTAEARHVLAACESLAAARGDEATVRRAREVLRSL